jgi:hypothetical protein
MSSALASHPAIRPLLQQFTRDSVRWANAELDLARLEVRVLVRRCVAGAVFAIVAFAALLTSLVILAETGIEAATPVFGNVVMAGLAVGIAILVLAALCVLGMSRMFHWEAESLIFRWLASPPRHKQRS